MEYIALIIAVQTSLEPIIIQCDTSSKAHAMKIAVYREAKKLRDKGVTAEIHLAVKGTELHTCRPDQTWQAKAIRDALTPEGIASEKSVILTRDMLISDTPLSRLSAIRLAQQQLIKKHK